MRSQLYESNNYFYDCNMRINFLIGLNDIKEREQKSKKLYVVRY